MGSIVFSRQLKGWLDLVKWDYKRLAKELGYDESAVCAFINGTAEPSKQIMKKIMDLTHMGLEMFEYVPAGTIEEGEGK